MRHNYLTKKLIAALLTISMTIGSVGMIPAAAYAETEDTDTVSVSGMETDIGDAASGDPDERDIDGEVAALLANGDYVEGRVIVLYDTEGPAIGEELVGAGSLIGSAEQIAEVSAESYVNATGETLEMSGEELVGASSESPDDRIAVLAVEDQSRSTEEILRELSSDPRVLSAEPDYIISINDEGTGDIDDDTPEMFASISDEDITDSDNSESSENEEYEETDTLDEDALYEGLISDYDGSESFVGASGDLTPYQWGMSDGSNRLSEDFLKNSDVYSVNSPNWNTPGSTNSEGVAVVIDTPRYTMYHPAVVHRPFV